MSAVGTQDIATQPLDDLWELASQTEARFNSPEGVPDAREQVGTGELSRKTSDSGVVPSSVDVLTRERPTPSQLYVRNGPSQVVPRSPHVPDASAATKDAATTKDTLEEALVPKGSASTTDGSPK